MFPGTLKRGVFFSFFRLTDDFFSSIVPNDTYNDNF